jgi:hypothetical protein
VAFHRAVHQLALNGPELWIGVEGAAVDKTVARLNIEHYKRKLAQETDHAKRLMLQRLLDEEERKLKALLEQPSGQRKLQQL